MASSATAYATGANMLTFRDVRRLGQLLSDTGTPIATGSVASNSTLAALLLAASGEVEMAALKGGKYTPADLQGLDGAARAMLQKLVCDLAYYAVECRRAPDLKPEDVSGVYEAKAMLRELRDGETIFPTDAAIDAGLTEAVNLNKNEFTGNGRAVKTASRFFGNH